MFLSVCVSTGLCVHLCLGCGFCFGCICFVFFCLCFSKMARVIHRYYLPKTLEVHLKWNFSLNYGLFTELFFRNIL